MGNASVNASEPILVEVENGLLGLVEYEYQTLFEMFREIQDVDILRMVLNISVECFCLIKHEEFFYAVEKVPCPILSPLSRRYSMTVLFYLLNKGENLSGRKKDIRNRPEKNSGMGMMDIKNMDRTNTFILKRLFANGIFRLEYKVKDVGCFCCLRMGCVIPSLCPWNDIDIVGWKKGSACLCTHTDVYIFSGGKYKQLLYNDGDFSLQKAMKNGGMFAIEVDLRKRSKKPKLKKAKFELKGNENENGKGPNVEKKSKGKAKAFQDIQTGCETEKELNPGSGTLFFSMNSELIPARISDAPSELYFVITLDHYISIEFVSLKQLSSPSQEFRCFYDVSCDIGSLCLAEGEETIDSNTDRELTERMKELKWI